MKKIPQYLLLLLLIINNPILAQGTKTKDLYQYSGRVEKLDDDQIKLIGSASSIRFRFSGDICNILLSVDTPDHYNYVSLELDGKYIGRLKVESEKTKAYPITTTQKKQYHTLIIYKATEPSNGGIIFHEAKAEKILALEQQAKKKVEFIGASVFCGQGIDYMEINCGAEKHWFDQHNAYYTYPVLASRILGYDFQISAVSGIGIYRNWNTETEDQNTMPFVYGNLYLNKETSKPYDFSFKPEIIVIGIGNNDFYQGDGKTPRAEFNQDLFISAYIKFVQMLSQHNPETSFVLVTPLLEEPKLTIATECMNKIKSAFPENRVNIFTFKPMKAHGCYEHPDIKDSKIMAKQFADYMIKLNK